MTRTRLSEAEGEGRLEALRVDYEAAKSRIAEVGFTCEGSMVERYTSCHNPNCRCADPTRRHGPYYQLSWKQAGKTVSRLLSTDEAAIYRDWIANRRRLDELLDEMRDLSRQAGERILAEQGRRFHGPARPRPRRRPAS
ncbi:MAG: DUF6788 family protein [Acidimicrobiales bacterium]